MAAMRSNSRSRKASSVIGTCVSAAASSPFCAADVRGDGGRTAARRQTGRADSCPSTRCSRSGRHAGPRDCRHAHAAAAPWRRLDRLPGVNLVAVHQHAVRRCFSHPADAFHAGLLACAGALLPGEGHLHVQQAPDPPTSGTRDSTWTGSRSYRTRAFDTRRTRPATMSARARVDGRSPRPSPGGAGHSRSSMVFFRARQDQPRRPGRAPPDAPGVVAPSRPPCSAKRLEIREVGDVRQTAPPPRPTLPADPSRG